MAKISPLALLPLVISLGIAGMFYFNLGREGGQDLPSTMIGREAPALLKITDLRDDPAPAGEDLQADGIKFVNFWASWCGPCRAEHPLLEKMNDDGLNLIGINYKDSPDNALGFLAELGDPFRQIGADRAGRTGIEWGVYGVPETFVIDGEGKVIYRHPGPLTQRVLDDWVFPAIVKASAPPALLEISNLRSDPAPTESDLRTNDIKFINFWASWCGTCNTEISLLEKISEDGTNVIGINYKDMPDDALTYLDKHGDPYSAIGSDQTGITGLVWNIYGLPETLILGNNGEIIYRHQGPLTQQVLDERIYPAIAAASE